MHRLFRSIIVTAAILSLLDGARRLHWAESHSYRRADAAPLAATNACIGKNCRTSLNAVKWLRMPRWVGIFRLCCPKDLK